MKSFTINRTSWHYKLIREFGISGMQDMPTDICSYLRALVKGAFFGSIVLVFLLMLTIVLMKMMVDMLMGIAFSIYYQQLIFTDAGFSGAILFGLMFAAFVIFRLLRYTYQRPHKSMTVKSKPPGFIRTAYQSIKGKYCIKLDFK